MRTQLKKACIEGDEIVTSKFENVKIKEEPTGEIESEALLGASGSENCKENTYKSKDTCNDAENEVFFGTNSGRMIRGSGNRSRNGYRNSYRGRGLRGQDHRQNFSQQQRKKGRNPLDANGIITRCLECESINHWVDSCPDVKKREHQSYHEQFYEDNSEQSDVTYEFDTLCEVGLYRDDYDDPVKLKTLVSDSMSAALLDCGAERTVCGKNWLNVYLDTLSKDYKTRVITLKVKQKRFFKFGDGRKVEATKRVSIPADIGEKSIQIITDVINEDIPLLFSKASLKKAGSKLDFINDTINILNQEINLGVSRSGHYLLPLGKHRQVLVDAERCEKANIVLYANTLSPKETAMKLHRQFAHPAVEKLIKLVKYQDNSEELITAIKEVSETCKICQEYRKPPPRPVVGFPMATRFGQCVAMDLKAFGNVHLLHLIDHATRFSAGAVIRTKKAETVMKELFRVWISVFGAPDKFLSDNGGEFNNEIYREVAEKLNIVLKTTAAESPWSNGLVERHNQILGNMIKKTMADTGCSLEMAVMWSLNAHNSLADVHGFSPYQLVLGRNPSLPSLQIDRPPALNEVSNDALRLHLNALHAAREAHIQSENNEKIRRALRHNVRTSGEVKYVTGDVVYYKRLDSKKWRGPAVVIGQDSQQVLIKHGGVLYRSAPCRLTLARQTIVGGNRDDKNESSSDEATSEPQREEQEFNIHQDHSNSNSNTKDDLNRTQGVEENQTNELEGAATEDDQEILSESEDTSSNVGEMNVSVQDSTANEGVSGSNLSVNFKHIQDRSENETDISSNSNIPVHKQAGSSENILDTRNSSISDKQSSNESPSLQEGEQIKESHSGSNSNPDETSSITEQHVRSTVSKRKRGRPPMAKNKIGTSQKKMVKDRWVRFKLHPYSNWETVKLMSRAGKSTSTKYSSEWNTKNKDDQMKVINFDKDVNVWENADQDSESEEYILSEVFLAQENHDIESAKIRELESWKENNVYCEVEDKQQSCISTKWVIKPKVIDGQTSVKARLVLKGYEEEIEFRTDSPACTPEIVRLAIAIITTQRWKLCSVDFKTAFLQGKEIERDVFIKPPAQAKTNKIWKLKKTVYGLNDAPRSWYLKMEETILNLGCKISSLANGLYYFHSDYMLCGIMVSFVDDLMLGGNEEFGKLIKELKRAFKVSHEHDMVFKYVGVNVVQAPNKTVKIDQNSYVESIESMPISFERSKVKHSSLQKNEWTLLRSKIGQLNWLSRMSRPDIAFQVCQASTSLKNATVQEVLTINKVISYVKTNHCCIKFPLFKDLSSLHLVVYTDASCANLKDGSSQGGQIIFLTDGKLCCPLVWHSRKIKRVVQSTLAAETLALVDGCEEALILSMVLGEVINGDKEKKLPILCLTDNKNLFETAHTSNVLSERRLLIEMAIVRQMVGRKEISLGWVEGKEQLSDVLTKNGASSASLKEVLERAQWL